MKMRPGDPRRVRGSGSGTMVAETVPRRKRSASERARTAKLMSAALLG
jgi:hypothetical protein